MSKHVLKPALWTGDRSHVPCFGWLFTSQLTCERPLSDGNTAALQRSAAAPRLLSPLPVAYVNAHNPTMTGLVRTP